MQEMKTAAQHNAPVTGASEALTQPPPRKERPADLAAERDALKAERDALKSLVRDLREIRPPQGWTPAGGAARDTHDKTPR